MQTPPIQLIALPAFTDNYIWMLHNGMQALVIDPGEAKPVLQALDAANLQLAAILVTHHHADHVGGIEALRPRLLGPVHAPLREDTPRPHVPHAEGDTFELLGISFTVLDVPGHTRGHIAYVARPHEQPPILFCGDTLFSGGCGRLFEGTAAQMHASLNKLSALPSETRVCCAHEYTLSNLRFAAAVEPDNADVADHVRWCEVQRQSARSTLPSTLARELRINPFLRSHVPAVARSGLAHGATSDEPVQVFTALREWKNTFR